MEDNKHEQLGEFGAIPGAPNGPPQSAEVITEVAVSELEIHPLAEIFPPMSEREFEELVEDIKTADRVIDPLWTYKGKVIDGRNRLLACRRLGMEKVPTREWNGKGSLLEFIVSLNLRRRHLKERQRAMIAARMKPTFEEEAQSRMKWAAKDTPRVNLPQGATGHSRDNAAKMLNVSGKSVDYACRVLANGIPQLIAAVDACKLAVSTAAVLAALPHEEQARVLAGGHKAVAQAVSLRRKHKPTACAPIDPVLEQRLIDHFTTGWMKLSRAGQGFRLQFHEFHVEDLQRAINSEHFDALLDCGVTLVKVKKP